MAKRARIWYTCPITTVWAHIEPFFKGFPRATGLWSLAFLCALLAVNGVFLAAGNDRLVSYYQKPDVLGSGGPSASLEDELGALVGSSNYSNGYEAQSAGSPLLSIDSSSVFGVSTSLAGAVPVRDGIVKYKVRKGDTLSGIAARFGITMETIRNANPDVKKTISVGEQLTILPVSGVLYHVREGDSINLVASRFQIDPDLIKKYNSDYLNLFATTNQAIILPYTANTAPVTQQVLAEAKGLPDLGGYFVLPAKGWNWGKLHEYNAVDIANACGSSVYAAAPGVVIEESSNGSWNNGYGNYVFIEHPNGTKTRYAHTLKNLVKVGDVVKQGEEIARMGNTGNTGGATGCHVHFEVYGAKNPFAVK